MDSPAAKAATNILSGCTESKDLPETAKLTVAVRVRPLTDEEEQDERMMSQGVVVDGTQIQVNGKDGRPQRTFAFDHCFDSTYSSSRTGSQEYMFETVGRKVLKDAWEGYNTCVFAYGQTGSGKTHTMVGGERLEDEGLLPRIGRELLNAIDEARYQNELKMAAAAKVGSRTSYGGYRSADDEDYASTSSNSSGAETGSSASAKEEEKAETEEDLVEFHLKASYVELYNEKFYDLLSQSPTTSESLKLREDPKKGVFLQGATWQPVDSWSALQDVLERGKAARRTAATRMNEMSSRSHAIFMLEFRQATNKRSLLPHTSSTSSTGMAEDAAVARVSQICLVDLAGSERREKSGTMDPVRAREGSQINLSLVHLGKVLNNLANQSANGVNKDINGGTWSPTKSPSKQRGEYINYRDSKLTLLLRESLGGNAKTIMLATVAPSHGQMNETVNTLGYANSAKNIFTRPHVNEDPKDRVIRQLLEEMNSLREQLAVKGGDLHSTKLPPFPSNAGVTLEREMEGVEAEHVHGDSPDLENSGRGRDGNPQRSPVMLKMDGKEQDEAGHPKHVHNGKKDDGRVPSPEDCSVVSAKPDEDSAQRMVEDDLAPSTSSSLATGPNGRLRSKSAVSDKQPGGASANGWHGRKPSELNNRLPRLAKAVVAQGGALPTPVSGSVSPALKDPPTTKRYITPDDSVGPMTITSTATHTLKLDLKESGPTPSYYNTAHMSLGDVREMRKRFLSVEGEICAQAIKNLGNEGDVSMFSEQILSVLPLVIEANSLAQSGNKPVAFYVDVIPRHLSKPVVHLEQALSSTGHAALTEAMALKELCEAQKPVLLPALLDTAEMLPTVVVRARGSLNDSIRDMSVEEFKESLTGMRAARARPDGHMPLLEGGGHRQHRRHDSLDPSATGLAASMGSAMSAESDAFHFEGQDSLIGRTDVYLSALLDNRNVLGRFPLLEGVEGACIGTVKIRLIPQDDLSSTPTLGIDKSYTLRLELDSLEVEKKHLGQLGLGGAWNSNPASSSNPALRYPDEQAPSLVLRYGFWPYEACGEVELSSRSCKIREMFSRSTTETLSYPVAHQATFHVETITPAFLTYLGTGALRMSLHLTRDPSEGEVWSRQQSLPQTPTDRCDALTQVHPTGPPTDSLPQKASSTVESDGGESRGRRPRAIRTEMPDAEAEEGDNFSVMGSLAPPGAFDTCSAMGMRMNGKISVRQSQSTRHATQFYQAQHPDTACFLFMGVDVLEPVLEPGVDYFSELPSKYIPVDIKPTSSFRRRFTGQGGRRGLVEPVVGVAGINPVSLLMQRSTTSARTSRYEERDEKHGLEEGMEEDNVSDMGDPWDGSDLGSVVSSTFGGQGGPSPSRPDRPSGADAVFHVMANPLIRMRQMKIVLEQVGPLAGPMLLESVLHVRASGYESGEERLWTGVFQQGNLPVNPLEVLRVERTVCKRRMEVTVALPTAQNLYETSGRGDRVYLGLEIAVFIEGAVQPVIIPRTLVMKVLPPARHEGMMYTLKKTLQEPLSDRLHRVGTYYAVKTTVGPHVRETVADFIRYKLTGHKALLESMETARLLQEGSEDEAANPADMTFAAWKAALKERGTGERKKGPGSATGALPGVVRGVRDLDLGEEEGAEDVTRESFAIGSHAPPQPLSTMALNVEERKAVASALFGVDLAVQRRGKGALPMRAPNGVYYLESIPVSEGRPVTYTYPARGMGDQAMREQVRRWDTLSPMWVQDVPDFPTGREGFLSMRTGLLNANSARLWFVWRRPFLFIYKSKPAGKTHVYQAPVDVVNVTDCQVSLSPKDELGFRVEGLRKTLMLQAANEDDLTAWLLALGQPVKNLPAGVSPVLHLLMNGHTGTVHGGLPLLCYSGGASSASVASVSTHTSHFQAQARKRGVAQHLRGPGHGVAHSNGF